MIIVYVYCLNNGWRVVPDLRLEVDDRKDIKSTVDSIIVSSLLVDVNTDAESNR